MNQQFHKHVVLCAKPADAGKRLDAFLTQKMPEFSRAYLSKLIKAGQVLRHGLPTKCSQLVNAEDSYAIFMPDKAAKTTLVPKDMPLDVLYSDEHIAVINKPQGLVVHPGAGAPKDTLCHALLYHFPEMNIGNEERPGIVHRLDKNTSGVMVVAKSQASHQILSDDFKERRIKKYYRVYCFGKFAAQQFSLITGHVRHPYNRLRFFTGLCAPKSPQSAVRLAHTHFLVKAHLFNITEVQAQLHTGRTHQIRAHLADIGHPIVGDELYGGKREVSPETPHDLHEIIKSLPGQALHAEKIELDHPITKEPMTFSAPLPAPLLVISQIF